MAKDNAHRTRQARAQVNKRQVAVDTAHTCASMGGRGTGNNKQHPSGGHRGADQPSHLASSRGGTPRPLVRARPGCIRDPGKRQP